MKSGIVIAALVFGINALEQTLYNVFNTDNAAACQCSLQPCLDTEDTCLCQNTQRFDCFVRSGGTCQLNLQRCEGQIRALTLPGTQYPPCGRGLPQCANNMYCKKLDNACIDLKNEGNCIGSCAPKDLLSLGGLVGSNGSPKGQPTAAPARGGGLLGLLPAPAPAQPQPLQAPSNPLNPLAPRPGNAPPSNPLNPLTSRPGSPPPQSNPLNPLAPRPGAQPANNNPLAGLIVQPVTINKCPATVTCKRNEVCVPHNRQPGAYLCANTDEDCGTWRNKKCSAGKVCLADPRYTCDRFTNVCSGRDGVCVMPV